MTWLEVVGAWGIALTVKLGVPVVILFMVGNSLRLRHSGGGHAQVGRHIYLHGDDRLPLARGQKRSLRC